jgi:ribosomal protein S18 acetylase RimI-like enzyme
MEIVRLAVGDDATVANMSNVLDGPAIPEHTRHFLEDDRHHLLVAREADKVVGFVSGVEMTHPDKGTEMFLYELGVDVRWRRHGVGAALVTALAELARQRACYAMWVLTDDTNEAAIATYTSAGGSRSGGQVMIDWRWTGAQS